MCQLWQCINLRGDVPWRRGCSEFLNRSWTQHRCRQVQSLHLIWWESAMQQLVCALFHLRHTDLFSAKHRGFSGGKVKPFKFFPHSVPIIPHKSFCFWQFHANVAKLRGSAVPVCNPASKIAKYAFNVGYLAVKWTLIIIIAGFFFVRGESELLQSLERQHGAKLYHNPYSCD